MAVSRQPTRGAHVPRQERLARLSCGYRPASAGSPPGPAQGGLALQHRRLHRTAGHKARQAAVHPLREPADHLSRVQRDGQPHRPLGAVGWPQSRRHRRIHDGQPRRIRAGVERAGEDRRQGGARQHQPEGVGRAARSRSGGSEPPPHRQRVRGQSRRNPGRRPCRHHAPCAAGRRHACADSPRRRRHP